MNFNFFVNIITIFIAIIILKIYFSIFFEKQKAHEYNPFFWIIYLIWQLFFMNCASISSSFKLTLNIILVIFICLYYFIGNIFSKNYCFRFDLFYLDYTGIFDRRFFSIN